MEFIVIIKILCISFVLFLTPCACASLLHDQLHSSHHQGHAQQLTLSTLPRKLKLNEVTTVKEDGAHDEGLKKEIKVLSEKSHKKEAQVLNAAAARVGTRQEWMQRSDSDTSLFFTMDYAHVRRRRPIHNKSVPVAP